jgi:hypothetical protein
LRHPLTRRRIENFFCDLILEEMACFPVFFGGFSRQDAVSVESGCDQDAIRIQSGSNQDAISSDPGRTQDDVFWVAFSAVATGNSLTFVAKLGAFHGLRSDRKMIDRKMACSPSPRPRHVSVMHISVLLFFGRARERADWLRVDKYCKLSTLVCQVRAGNVTGAASEVLAGDRVRKTGLFGAARTLGKLADCVFRPKCLRRTELGIWASSAVAHRENRGNEKSTGGPSGSSVPGY